MISKTIVDSCLEGIHFPAGSEEIAECATGNSSSCPSEILSGLRRLPSKLYRSEDEVLVELGKGDVGSVA